MKHFCFQAIQASEHQLGPFQLIYQTFGVHFVCPGLVFYVSPPHSPAEKVEILFNEILKVKFCHENQNIVNAITITTNLPTQYII
jgi:hypothetical protein